MDNQLAMVTATILAGMMNHDRYYQTEELYNIKGAKKLAKAVLEECEPLITDGVMKAPKKPKNTKLMKQFGKGKK